MLSSSNSLAVAKAVILNYFGCHDSKFELTTSVFKGLTSASVYLYRQFSIIVYMEFIYKWCAL